MLVTVDTGGTKTLVASFLEDGSIAKRVKFPTPQDQGEYVTMLTQCLYNEFSHEITALSIAVPGVIEHGVIVACSNLPWKNFNLKKELSNVVSCPILLNNDAKLAALAEANSLNPIPELCMYVTISTGIGIGIVYHGKLVPALGGSEAGRMMLERDGVMLDWESFASGRAIYKTYGKYASEIKNKAAWNHIAHDIAQGLLALIPALTPDTIVIGGSIGTYFDNYHKTLVALLEERLPHIIKRPRLLQAQHPQEAVIYGCYYYAIHRLTR